MVNTKSKTNLTSYYLDLFIFTILLVVSMLLVRKMLYQCYFGFDLTDEGYALNWISNPWIYKVSATQFGYIYYPLYRLLGENLALLRQVNILITLALSWSLSIQLLKYIFDKVDFITPFLSYYLYAMAFIIATFVFNFFGPWFATPNYDSLVLDSYLLGLTGLLVISRQRKNLIGYIIFSVAAWLAFMAKPTSAIMLGFIALIYLLLIKKLKPAYLFLALIIILVLIFLSAYIIDGSI